MIKQILDIVIPRFATEWLVLETIDDELLPFCALSDLKEYEFRPDMVFQKAKSFNFFGIGLLPKFIGNQYRCDYFYELDELPE